MLSLGNTFFYKKAIDFSVQAGFSTALRTFVMNATVTVPVALLAIAAWPWLGMQDAWHILNWHDALLFSGLSAFATVGAYANQHAYANEKMSVLAPFGQTAEIATILFSFLFLSGNSVIAFVAALVASGALLAGSVDFSNFRVSRYSAMVAIGGLFRAISLVFTGFLLVRYPSFAIVASRAIIECVFAVIVVLALRGFMFPTRMHLRGPYLWFILNNACWLVTYMIGLFLIRDLGMVFASLLGMLSLIAVMGLSWWMGERPSRKECMVAGIVSVCILLA